MTTLPEVAFDESGNTGADLLNRDQPVFALASTCLTSGQSEALLDLVRTHQTGEVKFSRLKRSPAGRMRLLKLVSAPSLTERQIKVSYVHKRFMVLAKMVDLLVEPLAYRDGLDFFKRGMNVAYSNLLYACLPVCWGAELTDQLLSDFTAVIYERTPAAIRSFYSTAVALYERSSDQEVASLLAPLIASQVLIDDMLEGSDASALDPAIPAFVLQCALWGAELGERFSLIHDDSKPIFQNQASLEDLMSRGEPEETIGYGSRRFQFPLRSTAIRFGKSHLDARLQIADLFAGAGVQWIQGFGAPEGQRSLHNELDSAGMGRFTANSIWPTSDISPDLSVANEINAIDHMAAFLGNHRR